MKRKDLIDQEFDLLTVKEYAYTKDGRAYWKCECKCGNVVYVSAVQLYGKKTTSCGCKWGRRASEHPNWRGHGEISASWWRQFLGQRFRRTKKKEVEITIEDAWQKFLDQDRLCRFTGLELIFNHRDRKNHTASLDRIDSNGHYTKDNIQWIHKQINIMKNDLSDEEFIKLCCLVADYSRQNFKKE